MAGLVSHYNPDKLFLSRRFDPAREPAPSACGTADCNSRPRNTLPDISRITLPDYAAEPCLSIVQRAILIAPSGFLSSGSICTVFGPTGGRHLRGAGFRSCLGTSCPTDIEVHQESRCHIGGGWLSAGCVATASKRIEQSRSGAAKSISCIQRRSLTCVSLADVSASGKSKCGAWPAGT